MATLPVQRTWTVGETVTAAMLNDDVRDAVNFLTNPPSTLVYNAAIGVANGTVTYMTFTSERYDTDAIHSTTTNTGRLTCTLAGVYTLSGYASFASGAGGQRHLVFRINGTGIVRQPIVAPIAASVTNIGFSFAYKLAAGDYVEMGVYQDSGGILNVTPEFGMTWMGTGV